jgi:hypothetical protein
MLCIRTITQPQVSGNTLVCRMRMRECACLTTCAYTIYTPKACSDVVHQLMLSHSQAATQYFVFASCHVISDQLHNICIHNIPKACSDVVHQYHCSTATCHHAAICVELASVNDQVHDLRIHCMPKYPAVCFDVMHQSSTQSRYVYSVQEYAYTITASTMT